MWFPYIGLQINHEFGLSLFGLSGTHLQQQWWCVVLVENSTWKWGHANCTSVHGCYCFTVSALRVRVVLSSYSRTQMCISVLFVVKIVVLLPQYLDHDQQVAKGVVSALWMRDGFDKMPLREKKPFFFVFCFLFCFVFFFLTFTRPTDPCRLFMLFSSIQGTNRIIAKCHRNNTRVIHISQCYSRQGNSQIKNICCYNS